MAHDDDLEREEQRILAEPEADPQAAADEPTADDLAPEHPLQAVCDDLIAELARHGVNASYSNLNTQAIGPAMHLLAVIDILCQDRPELFERIEARKWERIHDMLSNLLPVAIKAEAEAKRAAEQQRRKMFLARPNDLAGLGRLH